MIYKTGFAGFYFHVSALYGSQDPRVRIVGIADRVYPPDHLFYNPDNNPEKAAESKGVKLYDDVTAMLDAEQPDIVGVFAVDATKADIIVEALRRNKHVIADKPLCITMEQCERIAAASSASRGSLAMILPVPHMAIIAKLREIIQAGELGQLLMVRSRRAYIQKVSRRPRWFFTKQYGGGILCDVGTHDVDLIRCLTSADVKEVTAYAGNGKIRQFETGEDYSAALFRLSNGVLYTLQLDRIAPSTAKGDQCSLEVFGTKGQAVIPTGYQQLIVTREGQSEPAVFDGFKDACTPTLVKLYLDNLDNGRRDLSCFAPQVFNSVRAALCAQKSADQGGVKVMI